MRFKRGRGNGAARDEIFINLASLIDIIFVLLLFFVVTTTFTRENQLTIELPEAGMHNQAITPSQRLEITISIDGKYAVNGRVLPQSTEQSLLEALNAESGGNKDLPVLVTADANAKYQSVITAMSAAGQLGFSKLRLVTVESKQ